MALTKKAKQLAMSKVRKHDNDTGSAEVQISILTKRIEYLTKHLKTHKKDHHSRRGLLKLVSKRRHLLKYLQRNDKSAYQKTLQVLGLKK